jgi:phosphopentomutase
MRPPATILNRLDEARVETIGIGKISDIFSGSGIARSHFTRSNAEGCATIDRLLSETATGPRFLFANLVDFDMLYGHRRDPAGYARALSEFDEWFGRLLPRLGEETLLLITADHGNDATWTGSDHTRERVPLLMKAPGWPRNLGTRDTFADVAATIAEWFEAAAHDLDGRSFLG